MKLPSWVLFSAGCVLIHATANAQEPNCPNGRSGDWIWEAREDTVAIFHTGARWNLMSADAPPAEANATVVEFEIGTDAQGKQFASFGFGAAPEGYEARAIDGTMRQLFYAYSHRYAIGLAMVGADFELMDEKVHNGGSLNLFSRHSRRTEPESRQRIIQMVRDEGDIGFIITRPDPVYVRDAANDHPVAYALLPADGRAAALDVAMESFAELGSSSCKAQLNTSSLEPGD